MRVRFAMFAAGIATLATLLGFYRGW